MLAQVLCRNTDRIDADGAPTMGSKTGGTTMSTRRVVEIFFVAGMLAYGAAARAQGASPLAPGEQMQSQEILGTWACNAIRAQNVGPRPLMLVFHPDGTVTYSSGTNLTNIGQNGRGNGYGDWKQVGAHDYNFHAIEILRLNGNAGGRFLVDATLHVRQAGEITDSTQDQLCTTTIPASGLKAADPCPTANWVRATKFVGINALQGGVAIADPATQNINFLDKITDEVDLLHGPMGNGIILSALRCNRIDAAKMYSPSGSAVFPICDPNDPSKACPTNPTN
jgi:hypothetical protein